MTDKTTLRYTAEHEWVLVEGAVATVGITAYAAEKLGDIVFVEVPDDGKSLTKGDEAAVVESVKAASDVYSPVGGTVIEGNPALADQPDLGLGPQTRVVEDGRDDVGERRLPRDLGRPPGRRAQLLGAAAQHRHLDRAKRSSSAISAHGRGRFSNFSRSHMSRRTFGST